MDNITVSIFMLAYNQEEYIAQAIEGVLMQKTSFKTQLVIGEDCSTDSTRSICSHYAELFPHKIKLLLNEENIGLGANYVKTYSQCKGQYVAICDGDDYWTDPNKLQKQVEFLESNREFSLVFTNNRNIYPSGKFDERDASVIPEVSSFADLVKNNYIASVTAVFLNKPLPESMKGWMKNLPYGDWPTYLLVTKEGGKIKFINIVTATYRKNFGTSTALRKERCKMGEINVRILKNLCREKVPNNFKALIKKSTFNYQIGLIACYNKEHYFLRSLTILVNVVVQRKSLAPIKIFLYSLKRYLTQ